MLKTSSTCTVAGNLIPHFAMYAVAMIRSVIWAALILINRDTLENTYR